jgi:malate/lactate dehydrogenase
LAKGFHGVDADVFLSLPVVVTEAGITAVFKQNLDEEEQNRVVSSAKTLHDIISGIQL